MYDYDFYEQMDSLMVNLLVDLAINMVRVLYATVRYVLMQPIRLVEYIWYCIRIEREWRMIFHLDSSTGGFMVR